MDPNSPQEWINATELRIAQMVEHLQQSSDVLKSLSEETAQYAQMLQDAKRFQLGFVPVQPAAAAKIEQPAAPVRPRQSFRSVMADIQKEYGEQFANYVMGNMLGASRTVESVQKAMKTFIGTFSSPEGAAEAFAKTHSLGDADPFEVMANARYRFIHENGLVSIWSNFIAPGDTGEEEEPHFHNVEQQPIAN